MEAQAMKTGKDWLTFTLNGKDLWSITLEGLFPGEIRETKALLAYENGCSPKEISLRQEVR
jgi:hypothetical protein